MKKRWISFILAALMLLTLVGCGKTPEDEQPPEESSGEVEPAPAPAPQPPEPVTPPEDEQPPEPVTPPEDEQPPEDPGPGGINPLTGLPMEPEYVSRRPVAVMLNNLKAAQPQLGVSQADIIYEVPAEGGITRMLGVFQTVEGIENLGSIRSTRLYYVELAMGHDAVLVHAGGSPEAYEKLRSWKVDHVDGVNGGPRDDVVFWRDAARRKNAGYEHSMLTSGERIRTYLSKGYFSTEHKKSYTYPQEFYKDGTPVGGSKAEKITLKFSNYKTGIFQYDAERRSYLISQYGSAYVDGNTGEQVDAVNVLFLETSISKIPGDSYGRLRVTTTGSGEGTYFCGGKSIPIRWSRKDRNSPFVYTLTNGNPLKLGEGRSYVCIFNPKSSSFTVE